MQAQSCPVEDGGVTGAGSGAAGSCEEQPGPEQGRRAGSGTVADGVCGCRWLW